MSFAILVDSGKPDILMPCNEFLNCLAGKFRAIKLYGEFAGAIQQSDVVGIMRRPPVGSTPIPDVIGRHRHGCPDDTVEAKAFVGDIPVSDCLKKIKQVFRVAHDKKADMDCHIFLLVNARTAHAACAVKGFPRVG